MLYKIIKKSFFGYAEKFMLFLFFSLFFTFLLYFTGNFQYFLDSNQIMLIKIAEIISVILLVCSVFYGSMTIVTNTEKGARKKKRVSKYVFFISFFLFSTIIFFISGFVLVWTR